MPSTTTYNDDVENYFVVATEPYNVYDGNKLVFEVFRGQYFRWFQHTDQNSNCSSCGSLNGFYLLMGYPNCPDFTKPDGTATMWQIPDHVLEETYDTEDMLSNIIPTGEPVCESWFHETGGYNKDVFTKPEDRDEYKEWNEEKGQNTIQG